MGLTGGQAERMAATYSTGAFSRIVAAGGSEEFINLGLAAGRRRESTAHRQLRMANAIADAIAPREGEAIADLGCGRGGLLLVLARRAPGACLTGVNVDALQLAVARRCLDRAPAPTLSPIALVQADAHQLPFDAACLDAVCAVELLSHLERKDAFLAEAARVLVPGGRLVLAAITLARPFRTLQPEHRDHLRRLAGFFAEDASAISTPSELKQLLASAGFAVELDRDLTDAVFPPRYETFAQVHAQLCHRHRWRRTAARLYVRGRWRADPDQLERFLCANLALHPCRFYEYHLIRARKPRQQEQ